MKTKIFEEIEFFYLKFLCNQNVLTPRLETESLVRKAISVINKHEVRILIDVGLWSWVIPISIEKNTNLSRLYWLEKSSRAIIVAEKNKNRHSSKLEIIKSDLLSYFLNQTNDSGLKNQTILITANLPYVKDNDWINMSEDTIDEPKMALFWWKKTGFELYKKFYKQVLEFKTKFKPAQIITIIEIWFDQRKVSEDFLDKLWIESDFFSDLCWVERFIITYI